MKRKSPLEKKIAKIYAEANRTSIARAEKYLMTFADAYERERLAAQTLTGAYHGLTYYQADQRLKVWLLEKIRTPQWEKVRESIAKILTEADAKSAAVINDSLYNVFADAANAEAETLARQIAKVTSQSKIAISSSFTIYDKRSVARLNNTVKILPTIKTKTAKATAWHNRQIQKAVQSGILKGQSIDKIAESITEATNMGERASVRSARTATIGAQNAGKQMRYEECHEMGIEMEKEWVAANDDRTRDSHADLDGERVPYDEEFSNGCMFPGDPDCDDPGEVWNCRCSMRAIIAGINDYERDTIR